MTAKIIDGKVISERILERLKRLVDVRLRQGHRPPGLATILVGDDPASVSYIKIKRTRAQRLGFQHEDVFLEMLPNPSDTEERLIQQIEDYNKNSSIDGILVQLPLPEGMNERRVLQSIDPKKDVDGLHFNNMGRLMGLGTLDDGEDFPLLVPCTPWGVMALLIKIGSDENEPNSGKEVVIIGRSALVGRPLATLLSQPTVWGNATVTLLHSASKNPQEHTRRADILIAAAGSPRLVKADWVKRGACVIDVGVSRVDGKLVGDVDFESVKEVAGWITPVPGGVGPMTVAMLMRNMFEIYNYKIRKKIIE